MTPMPSAGPAPDVEAALRDTLAEDANAYPGTGLDLAGQARAGVRRRRRNTLLAAAAVLVLAVPAGSLARQRLDAVAPQQREPAPVASAPPELDPRCRAQAQTLPAPAITTERLPDDARVTEVLRCSWKVEQRNGQQWRIAVQERAAGGLDRLVTILRTPDRRSAAGQLCSAVGYRTPPLWAKLDDGRWLAVSWPQAGCYPIFVGRDVYAGVHFVKFEEPVALAAEPGRPKP
jgi:hypothetical protein